MSEKLAATFHGSRTPTFVTVVGVGPATGVTDAAVEALVDLGWQPPRRVPTDAALIGPGRRGEC